MVSAHSGFILNGEGKSMWVNVGEWLPYGWSLGLYKGSRVPGKLAQGGRERTWGSERQMGDD